MADHDDAERIAAERIAEARIAEAQRTGQDWLDLGGLGLTRLPEALFGLTGLRRLNLGRLTTLSAEGWGWDWANERRANRVAADLHRLAALRNLRELSLEGSDCGDLTPIAGLDQLQYLDCINTQVSDLAPIAGLDQLQQLYCSSTQVSDLAPIAGLDQLQHLSCRYTQVSDLAPIAGLDQFQHLSCSNTQVSDLAPIAGLDQLQHLSCSNTQVNDLAPIVGLDQLQYLDCGSSQVSDLAPIADLDQLQHLDCGSSQVSDLAPIAGLDQLQHLSCRYTQVSDLAPIAGLDQLQYLHCSGNTLDDTPVEIWSKPSLKYLDLYDTRVPGIPDEALGYNCLDRLRAHLAELAAGSETIHDAKLLILGNGRAGKTQIARRLANQPFQGHWDSTHGIRVTSATLPAQDDVPETTLKLWDFGGQDIYHGTHALFVRSRALFLLAWSKETEAPESDSDPYGMVFRNHPLRYWVDYVRHLGRAGSPVVIAQTRVDVDGVVAPPLDGNGDLNATTVQVSSADPPRLSALRGALQDASAALYRQRGAVTIGKPRIDVQRRIEGMRRADGSMPEDHRLIEKATFEAWYTKAGGKADAEFALAYLNDNGTLFYRKGLFGDRVVLDHAWGMNAIYAVFDRKSATYARLQRRGGLFERADLATVWHDFTDAEQRLFLGMMRSCGICFVYRGSDYRPEDDDTTYLAPDLLPNRAAIQPQIDATWGHGAATHRQVFTYPFLHHGLIRGVVARLGELAQTRADYFRGGVCLYDARTQSRALVAQAMAPGEWKGTVTVETRDGQAELLLERLAELIQQENDSLGLTPTTDRARPERDRREAPDTTPLIQAARPPSDRPRYAVSYAWNETDGSGPDREAPVNRLCAAASARKIDILRDKTSMGPGDSILAFARQIAASPRVFVFLSDDYLQSAYCVRELYELWRECRQDRAELKRRVRVFKLDGANIGTVHARAAYIRYWNQEFEARSALHQELGLRGDDLVELDFIEMFRRPLMEILGMFQDTIRHATIEDFIRDAFDDIPEDG